jgi:hypothetical protein
VKSGKSIPVARRLGLCGRDAWDSHPQSWKEHPSRSEPLSECMRPDEKWKEHPGRSEIGEQGIHPTPWRAWKGGQLLQAD